MATPTTPADDAKVSGAASPPAAPPPPPGGPPSPHSSTTTMLCDTLTSETSTVPLAWLSLLTGLVDGAIYGHFQVWVGFQTGNIVQFSMNVAEYIYPWSAHRSPLLTLMRALSFSSFFLASLFGARVAKALGQAERKRWFLMASSFLQGVILFAASAILLSRPNEEQPSFQYSPAVIVLIAFSMGLQSIQSQKLSSPVFSTSVAFTATLTQIASDPNLFTPGLYLLGNQKCKGRDLRLLAIIALALGGGIAQSLLDSTLGLSGTVAVAAGFKVFAAVVWMVPRSGGGVGVGTSAAVSKA